MPRSQEHAKLNTLCIVSDRDGDYVVNGLTKQEIIIELNNNAPRKKRNNDITCYEIMHGEKKVAEINTRGEAVVLNEKFIPYDLFLEEERDFDTLFNNISR